MLHDNHGMKPFTQTNTRLCPINGCNTRLHTTWWHQVTSSPGLLNIFLFRPWWWWWCSFRFTWSNFNLQYFIPCCDKKADIDKNHSSTKITILFSPRTHSVICKTSYFLFLSLSSRLIVSCVSLSSFWINIDKDHKHHTRQ